MKRICHVNMHIVRVNAKNGTDDPAVLVKTYKESVKCRDAELTGPCRIVQRMHKPLSCGARIWIETEHPVIADGKEI